MKLLETQMLYVENVSEITTYKLRQMFCKFGKILHVGLGNNSTTKNCAFIVFEKVNDAIEAHKAMNNIVYQNKLMKIKYFQTFPVADGKL
ncbi:pre-mrna branch site p14-like protein [Vairimorpha ceranae]|uniref:Pre-mrna branch site p14-like protein n=1 Tax=Vairimorpha ceranae TaxID=40302 RepID=A0A0F9WQH1_9MICR|nr:pre-mrna branch site p14-like protein [Vairimorpha ceranae]KAF5139990.1 hypothetical protein G9O61_00g019100 [Vairimorpha ceranae]KKO75183.1 pre-mrna branch site p14-like protein [Vairimorpha ceranae]